MRFLAIIPVVLSAAALILSFLCLFAGSKKGFMEDYALVTLNTSRIGENVLNTTSTSSSSDNAFVSWVHNVTHGIENSIESDINDAINSIAQDLGLHDFYSAHILDYCEGYYAPGPVANATLKKNAIHKNVTRCSNSTAFYTFDPRETLQKELNSTGNSDIDLSDLHWPDEIDKGLKALRITTKAMFVLYCIAIGFIAVALVLAVVGVMLDGRLSAFINVVTDWFAFLAIGLASALSTAVSVEAAHIINKHGNDIGVSANKGGKFFALTWVATAVMLISSMVWCMDCIVGRSHRRGPPKGRYVDEPKYT